MQTYTGACHCGAVRYTVDMELDSVLSCNCSLCGKTGALLSFVPADRFTLVSGEDAQADYQFNKKIIHHLFCKTCGVRSFARAHLPDGKDMVAINVRCLDGVDIEALTINHYEGKDK